MPTQRQTPCPHEPLARAVICALGLLLGACEPQAPPAAVTPTPKVTPEAARAKPELLALHAEQLPQAEATAATFGVTIDALLSNPSPQTLSDAQSAWRDLQAVLERQAVLLRLHLAEPAALAPIADAHHALLAWPITPGVLDRFGPYEFSGLVFDISAPITSESLRAMHRQMGENEATLGLYALHYLLFGVGHGQTADAFTPAHTLGEADRNAGFETLDELPNNRRRKLLRVQKVALDEDLARLRATLAQPQVQATFSNFTTEAWRQALLGQLTEFITELATLTAAPDDQFGYGFDQSQQLYARVRLQAAAYQRLMPLLNLSAPEQALKKTTRLARLQEPAKEADLSGSAKLLYQDLSQLAQILQQQSLN